MLRDPCFPQVVSPEMVRSQAGLLILEIHKQAAHWCYDHNYFSSYGLSVVLLDVSI